MNFICGYLFIFSRITNVCGHEKGNVDQCGVDLSTDGPYFHELQTCVPE